MILPRYEAAVWGLERPSRQPPPNFPLDKGEEPLKPLFQGREASKRWPGAQLSSAGTDNPWRRKNDFTNFFDYQLACDGYPFG